MRKKEEDKCTAGKVGDASERDCAAAVDSIRPTSVHVTSKCVYIHKL